MEEEKNTRGSSNLPYFGLFPYSQNRNAESFFPLALALL